MKTTSIYKGNVRFLKEDGVVLEVDTPQGLIVKGMELKEKDGESALNREVGEYLVGLAKVALWRKWCEDRWGEGCDGWPTKIFLKSQIKILISYTLVRFRDLTIFCYFPTFG